MERSFYYAKPGIHVPQRLQYLTVRKRVQDIPDGAFQNRPRLETVEIENGVLSIGNSAFRSSGVATVSIPPSLLTVGDDAFRDSSLLQLRFQVGIQRIGNGAFRGCRSLHEVTFPRSLRAIGRSAFQECVSLTNITLNEGLASIGSSAFAGCESLVAVFVPWTVTSINKNTFSHCTSLTKSVLVNPESIDWRTWSYCTLLKEVSLGPSVKTIGGRAFRECRSLCYVKLPHTLTEIGEECFCNCTSLSALFLPSSLVDIRERAFASCHSLLCLEFHNGRETLYISRDAFEDCTSLISIQSPPDVYMGVPFEFGAWSALHLHDDVPFQNLSHRFNGLPLHLACYKSSTSHVDEIINFDQEEPPLKDAWGLTPFHLLATSPNPRVDLLDALLEYHYDMDTLAETDCVGNTMVHYLLCNQVPRSTSMLHRILQITLGSTMERWDEPGWTAHLNSEEWNVNAECRKLAFQNMVAWYGSTCKLVTTTQLELAVWKMALTAPLAPPPSNHPKSKRPKLELDRGLCRMVCGADIIITNVCAYLWQNLPPSKVPSVFLPYDVSWME